MKKLLPIIRYECATILKYIWIFYSIMCGVVLISFALTYILTGSFGKLSLNALEINSMVYLCVMAILGSNQDFKMLLQNGYPRKYIYLGALSLFLFTSVLMTTVDMIIAAVLRGVSARYLPLFDVIYGEDHSLFINWIWTFCIYLFVCSLAYFFAVLQRKIGKIPFVITTVAIGMTVLLIIPALVLVYLPDEARAKLFTFIARVFGFLADGSTSFLNPLLALFIALSLFGTASYFLLSKTELKT